MKKLLSILLSIIYFMFSICFAGCVGNKQATAQDFSLSIELSTDKLLANEDLIISAEFVNKTNNSFQVTASTKADESLIKIIYYKKGDIPDVTDITVAKEIVLKRKMVINKSVTLTNLEQGEYEVYALVHFSQNGSISVYSTIYNFEVL